MHLRQQPGNDPRLQLAHRRVIGEAGADERPSPGPRARRTGGRDDVADRLLGCEIGSDTRSVCVDFDGRALAARLEALAQQHAGGARGLLGERRIDGLQSYVAQSR